jgi:acyl-CoA reductase-like NAD-dependent aldehyde dehydrogenase
MVPFGGAKQSGIGREYGVEGLRAYMEGMALFLPPAQTQMN